jgi:hypothetical protein
MFSARRLAATVALAAGVSLAPLVATAAPAFAELPCAWDATPGLTSPWNYPIDGVACVVLDTSNGIRLVAVTDVQPGWTYSVKAAGGTAASSGSRVEIRFENKATGQRVDFRFEPGKTKIG